jgi:hypothetical protein
MNGYFNVKKLYKFVPFIKNPDSAPVQYMCLKFATEYLLYSIFWILFEQIQIHNQKNKCRANKYTWISWKQ